MIDEVAQARFWSYVIKTDSCWEWRGATDPQGYGYFGAGNRRYRAHRLAFELTYHPIPENLVVRHYCDNPACCRPDHLELGTHQDNSNDYWERHGAERSVKEVTGYEYDPAFDPYIVNADEYS